MPSKFRIPPADLSGPLGRLVTRIARRQFGQVPDSTRVLFHHPSVMWSVYGLEMGVTRWKALDPTLRSLAEFSSAAQIGCSWCMDFGYYLADDAGLDLAKLRAVADWRESDAFDDDERAVLAYSEAMTATPPTVTDDQVADLVERLGTKATVELTQIVALENMRSRFNASVGLEDQGYSSVCEIPFAETAAAPAGA